MNPETSRRAHPQTRPIDEGPGDHVQRVLLIEPVETEAEKFLCCLKGEIRRCVLWARDVDATQLLLDAYRPETLVVGCSRATQEGLQLVKSMRQNSDFDSVHVVVLSADHADLDICEAFNLGANRFFLKPCDDADYADCAMAIMTRESNLPSKIAGYERFPSDPLGD